MYLLKHLQSLKLTRQRIKLHSTYCENVVKIYDDGNIYIAVVSNRYNSVFTGKYIVKDSISDEQKNLLRQYVSFIALARKEKDRATRISNDIALLKEDIKILESIKNKNGKLKQVIDKKRKLLSRKKNELKYNSYYSLSKMQYKIKKQLNLKYGLM